MSKITLESSTDTQENVTAALGDKAESAVSESKETKSDSDKKSGETATKAAAKGSEPKEKPVESDEDEETLEAASAEGSEDESQDDDGDKDESEDGDDSQDDKQSAKGKRRGGFKRRIDKLTAKISEAEKEKEYWRQLALKNQKGEGDDSASEDTEKVVARGDGRPDPDDFESHEDYIDALTDWKVDQRFRAEKKQTEAEKLRAERDRIASEHRARLDDFAKDHEDFFDVLEDVDDIALSPAVEDAIVSSENGPALMYELAKNPDELKRIVELTPLAAARALGRIEAKLSLSSKQTKDETKTVKGRSKAPEPIKPVGRKSGGGVKKSIYDESLSQAEYERLRAEELKQRRAF